MFNEIDAQFLKNNRTPGEPEKRWFRDAEQESDLFVWIDSSGQVARFQFWLKEYLIEWDEEHGLKTGLLDRETGSFSSIQTPVFNYHLKPQTDIIPSFYNLIKEQVSTQKEQPLFRHILAVLEKTRRPDSEGKLNR